MIRTETINNAPELYRTAFSLYRPPFRFEHGYIFDNDNCMVADQDDACITTVGKKIAQVRGWGRISYMIDPENLQDIVGQLIAQALTEYWIKHTLVKGEE